MTGANLAEHLEDVDTAQRAGTAVEPQQKTARELILDMEAAGQFRRALPRHVDEGRFVRLVLTALRTVPRLAECSGESILAGVTQAAQLGLEIDAVRGQAYLVPRWNGKTGRMEASFQLGYKGLIDLAGRGGITVRARDVCEADLFEFEDGLEPKLRHIPELKKPRGEAWAYFAVATFPDREEREFVVISRAEAEEHRDRFASARNKKREIVGPWVEHFDAMARKTAVIKLLGQLPLPVEVVEALSMEDVPIDVTPAEPELPPPAPSGDQAEGPPAEDHDDEDRDPSAQETLEQRRALAHELRVGAEAKDRDAWKTFRQERGIAADMRQWSPNAIEQVIAWATEEPDADGERP